MAKIQMSSKDFNSLRMNIEMAVMALAGICTLCIILIGAFGPVENYFNWILALLGMQLFALLALPAITIAMHLSIEVADPGEAAEEPKSPGVNILA